MIVRNYSAAHNYRFYTGSDNNFVGGSYDFSGVGYGSHWATLVTENCFLSAYHYHPATGETITFHANNNPAGASYSYTVTGGIKIGSSDLWLGWFDSSVTVNPSIERYSVPLFPTADDYLGLLLYNYGLNQRVGLNVLDELGITTVNGSIGVVNWYDYDNNDIPSVGGDETMLQGGDSGGPSFTIVNSSLTLLGIHWALTVAPNGSLDTFVPAYVDAINAVLASRNQTLSLVSIPAPEPAIPLHLAPALAGLYYKRKRQRQSAL
jgi:hypothetical protein